MKIRHEFEPGDFEGGGQMIVRNSNDLSVDFMSSIAWKIGFENKSGNRCMVSLADGLVLLFAGEQELIDKLNNDKSGYRPMTEDECVAVSGHVGNRFGAWPAPVEKGRT